MKKTAQKVKSKRKSAKQSVHETALEYGSTSQKDLPVFHYKNLQVEHFRCLENIRIDSLERVNLITGTNNAGKTTLLEAIFLLIGLNNPELALRIERWRDLPIPTELTRHLWSSLFFNFRDDTVIKICGANKKNSTQTLQISVAPSARSIIEEKSTGQGSESTRFFGQKIIFDYSDQNFNKYRVEGTPIFMKSGDLITFQLKLEPHPLHPKPGAFIFAEHKGFIGEDLTRFSDLRIKQKDPFILKALKIIEPRLERLEILTWQGTNMIHGHLRGYSRPVPSPLLGGGVRRIMSILLAIGSAQENIVLIDEIENGTHHSVMKSIWEVIAEAADLFNTQIFATTHSQECIVAAHEAYKERKHYSFRLHRLDNVNGNIKVVTYNKESLEGALAIPLEVRGWPIE